MAFISEAYTSPPINQVPGDGPEDAKIAIVGSFPGIYEERAGRPFIGMTGTMLDSCMQSSGMIRSDVYITNVFKHKPKGVYYNSRRNTFSEKALTYVQDLKEELEEINPNVVVPLGNEALSALTGKSKVSQYRGYIMESTLIPGLKVIPSIHPSTIIRGKYIERYYLAKDLKRAIKECEFPEIRRPDRQLIYDLDFYETCEWLEAFNKQRAICYDLEVINFEVSCIGITSSKEFAVTIPMYEQWTESEEHEIWNRIAVIMDNPRITKIGQNLMFDIPFLLKQNGIRTRGKIIDTMIIQSLMYPDMLKGLGFLASIYCESPEYWKDMAEFKNIKEDD